MNDPMAASSSSSIAVAAEVAAANNATGLDLQDVGGAIEGWVRRVARRAASALESNTATSSSAMMGTRNKSNTGVQSLGVMGGGGMGDLIELVDAFEVGDDTSGEEQQHQQSVSIDTPMPATSVQGASVSARDSSIGGQGEMRGRRQVRDEVTRTII
jgi:hypothetical protein